VKVVSFDIECDTGKNGTFPHPARNAIITIGAKVGITGATRGSKVKWGEKVEWLADTYNDDSLILNAFIDYVEEEDPDLLTGYNVRDFDIPYIVDRARGCGIDVTRLGRDGFLDEQSVRNVNGQRKTYRNITLGERIIFDTYTHWAAQDDKLFGQEDRKLKTLLPFFAPDQDWIMGDGLYTKMRGLVGTDTLREYIRSDVDGAALMFDIYYPVFQSVVELFGNVTLKEITENTKGFLGMHTCKTCCEKAGIMFEGTNENRHGWVAIAKQAAIPNTYRPLIECHDVQHIDFSSMYATIIMTWNISPETTRIIGYEALGDFSATRNLLSGDVTLHIPDEKLDKNVIILISGKEGELPKLFRKLYDRRIEIKQLMAQYTKGSPEYRALDTEQSAIKMVMNSVTGYMAEIHARWADVAQYIAIVGIARELYKAFITHIEGRPYKELIAEYEKVNEKRLPTFNSALSPFKNIIQGDTDGFYLDKHVNLHDINEFLDDLVMTVFKATTSFMKVGEDIYDIMYCPNYRGKAYVLVDNGKLRFKGGPFKSSRLPLLFKNTLKALANARFLKQGNAKEIYQETVRGVKERTLPLRLFVMHVKVRDPEYYDKECMYKNIGLQARKRFDIDNVGGTSFEYVKLRSGHHLVTPTDDWSDLPGPLDTKWYLDKAVDRAVERLGMMDIVHGGEQSSLFNFGGLSV
jgi:DNA polymerase elongation subunit (family B)